MTRFVLMIVTTFLFVIPATAQEKQEYNNMLTKGDQALVSRTLTVKVLNQKPVSNGHRSFSYGNTCFVEERANLTLLEPYGNEVLVLLGRTETEGTNSCPGNKKVAFLMKKETFAEMKELFINQEPIAALLKRHGIE